MLGVVNRSSAGSVLSVFLWPLSVVLCKLSSVVMTCVYHFCSQYLVSVLKSVSQPWFLDLIFYLTSIQFVYLSVLNMLVGYNEQKCLILPHASF